MSDLKFFPESMRDSIRKVEKSREERYLRQRRGDYYPSLSLSDRQAWLEEFHPDHRADGRRALSVGTSEGLEVPLELATLLESWPRRSVQRWQQREEKRQKKGTKDFTYDYETDVLIIGGGGAGIAAAIAACEADMKVLVVTKLRPGDSNTIMAEGGIQVADQECDSPLQHFLDIVGGGHYTNDLDMVEALVSDGPQVLRWLEDLGMLFDKYATGRMKVRHGGGTSRKRLHSSGDVTGLELMRVLMDRARYLGVEMVSFAPAVELLTDENGRAVGALLERLPQGDIQVVRAGAVILATGGFGRIHLNNFPTSNHYGATADGLVMAYRAGQPLRDLQYCQYHPTGIAFPEQKLGLLATEKFRGMGAQLLNCHGDEFVYGLESRDVTTAAIIRECVEFHNGVQTPSGGTGIWLDIPMIDMLHGRGTIEREFPGRFREFIKNGYDIRSWPILTYPTLHYQNGGVVTQPDGSTHMPGLFACGEVTGGVHGHNRLMGNALLEILVFGLRSGRYAADFVKRLGVGGQPSLAHLKTFTDQLTELGIGCHCVAPKLLPSYGATLSV
ncbi:MAG: FAD-binding protein [Magnetococcus sp. DMHC-6]